MQDVEKGGGDVLSVYVSETSSRVGCNYYERGGEVRNFILHYLAPPTLSSVWAPFNHLTCRCYDELVLTFEGGLLRSVTIFAKEVC